jgi:hypothetical protein
VFHKSESRIPNSEGNPNSESRKPARVRLRISDFGILSEFGLRLSDFRRSVGLLFLCALPTASPALLAGEPTDHVPGQTILGAEFKPAQAAVSVANNTRCFVCHANYEDEPLSVIHGTNNISCIRCHGECSPHSTDEDGLTAPDRMFRKSIIRFNCLSCHDWVKLVATDKQKVNRADLPEKPNHQAVLDGTARDKPFCTDCHGEHRMFFRTRAWDKRTGVLVSKDGTPRMLPAAGK